MKKDNQVISIVSLALVFFMVYPNFATAMERGEKFPRAERVQSQDSSSGAEMVRWVGVVKDDTDSHTTQHAHELEFTRKDDGKTYGIEDSPDLVQLHHETEKNYLVEIEAEKTPKFLFWGGNLIVKKFRVLQEIGDPIAHRQIQSKQSSSSVKSSGRRDL